MVDPFISGVFAANAVALLYTLRKYIRRQHLEETLTKEVLARNEKEETEISEEKLTEFENHIKNNTDVDEEVIDSLDEEVLISFLKLSHLQYAREPNEELEEQEEE